MQNEAMNGAAPMQAGGAIPAAEAAAQPPVAPAVGEMQNASPEEQEAYNAFVGNGMKLLYSPQSFPKIVELLTPDEGQDPREALATAATTIISRVIQSAEEAGKLMSGEILLSGGTELFEELADLATKVGAHDFANDPDAMEGAMFMAMDQLRGMMEASGKIDKEAAGKEFAQLQQMSESGELEAMFRGLAQGGGQAPADEGQAKPAGGGLAQAAGVQ